VSLTWKPSDDVMVYGLYSEGFRIGGANVYSLATPGLPLTFDSDTTKNYRNRDALRPDRPDADGRRHRLSYRLAEYPGAPVHPR
jgi:hypothetical protein